MVKTVRNNRQDIGIAERVRGGEGVRAVHGPRLNDVAFPSPLIQVASLPTAKSALGEQAIADDLASAGIVIVDSRWYLDGRSGVDAYLAGHIPGARFVDLDTELAGPASPVEGRHPLPSPERFAAAMTRLGIGPQTPVVVYDDASGAIAARLWWMLRVFDHPVAVLDGGIDVWVAAGGELEAGAGVTSDGKSEANGPVPPFPVPPFPVRPWPADRFVSIDEIEDLRNDPSVALLDARSVERFRGDPNPIDPRFGHIPGALSAPFAHNMVEGRMQGAASIGQRYHALTEGCEQVVAYCGSGVTACHNLLAVEVAGLDVHTRLFPGSWSQWGADSSRPVATGIVASVAEVVALLNLERHPEGGWFRRVFEHPVGDVDGRPLSTAIHFLLPAGERSQWHRIDAIELWHFAGGDPVELRTASVDGQTVTFSTTVLGPDLVAGHEPTAVVPTGVWQCARSLGAGRGTWSLVGCTVSPGFQFEGFELAPPGWEPGDDR